MTVQDIMKLLEKTKLDKNFILTCNDIEDKVEEPLLREGLNFYWAEGASKYVIIPEKMDKDLVIKIPYSGVIDSFGEYEEFCGAISDTCAFDWDYCKVECDIFQKAKERDLEMCFAKTELIGTIKGYPIYAQEKAVIWENIHNYEDYDERERDEIEEKTRSSGHRCFNSAWLLDFLDYYGEEIFNMFLDFIDDMCIDDLHSGNIGYINDRPVLVDYSDFNR